MLLVVARFLVTAAASERSVAANFQLAVILAAFAGVLDSVGFVAVSLYSSHMTGMVASAADHLAAGSMSSGTA
ncbi:hypothetical protein GCM10011492_38590 [Flexivirga endophytica]|uniref:DUF1275 domain-containing protein n=1 Tax=Flexivirga endophytica TaxID=1849103 RepID=A0A916TG01_9MICO|nr:hypothetical protein GCM10011492_38590 [Flexivirga endophytica]GHB67998.1 hypothetical protein GCM10008112_40910 [Flexivirga endophytica]